jgi:hypothetical protein
MNVVGVAGTGPLTLGTAVPGFQTFAASGVANGEAVSYSATDGVVWEVGKPGIYNSAGPTLTRAPLYSSSGGALVSLGLGAQVWIAVLAEDIQVTTQAPVDTRTSPQTYTLPGSAMFGAEIIVFDLYGNAETNPITINGSGAGTPVINMNYGSIAFFWTGSVWFPF